MRKTGQVRRYLILSSLRPEKLRWNRNFSGLQTVGNRSKPRRNRDEPPTSPTARGGLQGNVLFDTVSQKAPKVSYKHLDNVHCTPREAMVRAVQGKHYFKSSEGLEALVSKLCEEGQLDEAFQTLELMARKGIFVSQHMLYLLLKACTEQRNLALGKLVHALTVRSGHEESTFLGNQVIRLYGSQGCFEEANQVLTKLPAPDEFVWASIISANGENGQPDQAIKLYKQMQDSGVRPNDYVFVAALKACATGGDLASGRMVHGDALQSGFASNVFVGNSLVDMYAKCGSLENARRVFETLPTKNVVTWNAMIAGYTQNGLGDEALELFRQMQEVGIEPNSVTFGSILKACGSIKAINDGRLIHAQVVKRGLCSDTFVVTALLNMFIKCGSLVEARDVFDKLPNKNLVTWTTLITGYAQNGRGNLALELYCAMQEDGLTPDNVTFVSALQACGSIGAILTGRKIHAEIVKRRLLEQTAIGNSLLDMYGKCASLGDAQQVFEAMPRKDVGTWNTLINAYGQNNEWPRAKQVFENMLQEGCQPNSATFTCLLVGCSHMALADEGQMYFRKMVEEYSIQPAAEHYNSMVDLLGRSGRLAEAENVLLSAPFNRSEVGWTSLLSACRPHGNCELARRCFDQVVALNPEEASAYVLMSSIYAEAGRWDDVADILQQRKCAGAQKKPAKAAIELNNKVHEFLVGDKSFERSAEAWAKLRSLNMEIRKEGFVPRLDSLLKPMSDEEKEDALCGHAEKLALGFGLLHTPEGTGLLITKDLRMCSNCHGGTKIISRLERREIVIRDSHRVHRFRNGSCSCGDHY